MADIFSKKKRSQIMSKIKGKGTTIEVQLARILNDLGMKPKLNSKSLPGSPDFVLQREKIVIFTNGCFWHSHARCSRASLPATNQMFWREKIENNRRRDERQKRLLRRMGWHIIIFWTCQKITPEKVINRLKLMGVRKQRLKLKSIV